jgi:phosphate transport system substrate-binding protein
MLKIRHSLAWLGAVAIAVALATTGCNNAENYASDEAEAAPAPSAISSAIGGPGSTFVDPLMKGWVTGFEQSHPNILVNYRAIGSGAGIQELEKRMTEFGASDAPLTDEQLRNLPPMIQVPVSAGPVCIVYNVPQLTAPLPSSAQVLADILRGEVVTWNDPAIARDNPGAHLPKAAIIVVHRADGSGTTNILTTYLSKVSPEWAKNPGAGLTVAWPMGFFRTGQQRRG